MNDKIKVINTLGHEVGLVVRDFNFNRHIAPHGFIMVKREDFEQIMYDPGVSNMINEGTIYIEDLEVKKDLGLEPEDAEEPVNIIVLDEKKQRQMMIATPLDEFKKIFDKLSTDQRQSLADYAIEHRLADYDKCEYIRLNCGRDVIKAIRLGDQNKEE